MTIPRTEQDYLRWRSDIAAYMARFGHDVNKVPDEVTRQLFTEAFTVNEAVRLLWDRAGDGRTPRQRHATR